MTVLKLNGFTKNGPENYQVIPRLSLLVLNLMPNKQTTEKQINRLLTEVASPVSVTYMYPETHQWKHGNQRQLAQLHYTVSHPQQLFRRIDRHRCSLGTIEIFGYRFLARVCPNQGLEQNSHA